MGLTSAQKSVLQKQRSTSSGVLGVRLGDARCAALIYRAARDLGEEHRLPSLPADYTLAELFDAGAWNALTLPLTPLRTTLERLFEALVVVPDADTFFECIATLHRARLKYRQILSGQPFPTIDQVGPRGLLEYGEVNPRELVTLLFWRKWMFDIDNRAGQETGYVFEPILARALGGAALSDKRSPVRRRLDQTKGRQVDCMIGTRAYELKLRVTIAASGKGRVDEEMSFPEDCEASGFTPVLVVFDGTHSAKLGQLRRQFERHGGESYVGEEAWAHLRGQASPTLRRFLEKYVQAPLDDLLAMVPVSVPSELLPMQLRASREEVVLEMGAEQYVISRHELPDLSEEEDLGNDSEDAAELL